MEIQLDAAEARVLGCLLEKEMTTPEYYPLTLNSLIAAVNQKSNRDPVVDWEADVVEEATDGLRDQGLAFRVDTAGSRVSKFRYSLDCIGEMPPAEKALLCVLLLRGPQTVGELRARTERMHGFATTDAVAVALGCMENDYGFPLVRQLPRQPGRKEVRWACLLGGEPEAESAVSQVEGPSSSAGFALHGLSRRGQQLEELQAEVAQLRGELQQLRQDFDALRSQLE